LSLCIDTKHDKYITPVLSFYLTESIGMSTSFASRTTPPVVPLALRVGVVGHRPDRLQQANLGKLSGIIGEILDTIKTGVFRFQTDNTGLYSDDLPVLRAISPLAEGTDRIFAEQAFDAGYELCCIMPFHQVEFEKDFDPLISLEPGSLGRFRDIINSTEVAGKLTRFELDGNRKNSSQAYSVCGKTVLNQSDLLIVVWDGEYTGKPGGTEETFREAQKMGIPMIWIDAREGHAWQLIKSGNDFNISTVGNRMIPSGLSTLEDIRSVVYGICQLPDNQDNIVAERKEGNKSINSERSQLEIFYTRRKPPFMTAVIWKCFRDIFGDGKFPKPVFQLENFEEAVKDEWPEDISNPVGRMVNTLRPYYAWPDKLAVLFSDRYRSAFIITFLTAALAVGLALLPFVSRWDSHSKADIICIAIEMIMILIIISNVYLGRRNKWHERWIDYRLLAESIRHLRLVAPMGGGRPFLQPQAHLKTYGQPESGWVAWYVRAVERCLRLPSIVVDKMHLQTSLGHLLNLIESQIGYHEKNAGRCRNIEGKLHSIGFILFALTFVSCFIHFITGVWLHDYLPSWLSPRLMTFFCAFFPALGAAMAGINNQGEFTRISKRSEAMFDQLNLIKIQVKELISEIDSKTGSPDEQYSVKTSDMIKKTARLLTNEVLDWRVVFLDRPLNASA
jgi:hypothetical protein